MAASNSSLSFFASRRRSVKDNLVDVVSWAVSWAVSVLTGFVIMHAIKSARVRLGRSVYEDRTFSVRGESVDYIIHLRIASFSYVHPSAATTGFFMILSVIERFSVSTKASGRLCSNRSYSASL